jgi:hypothetical protein
MSLSMNVKVLAMAGTALLAWNCTTKGAKQNVSNPDAVATEKDIKGNFSRLAKKGEHAVAMTCETPQALKGGSVEGDAGQTPEGVPVYSVCDVTQAMAWADFVKLADKLDTSKKLSSSVETADDSATISDEAMKALVSAMKAVEKKDPPKEAGLNLNGYGNGGGGGYSGGLVYVAPTYYYKPADCDIYVRNWCAYDVQVNLLGSNYNIGKSKRSYTSTLTQGNYKIGFRYRNSYGNWYWSWENDQCEGRTITWTACNR